MNDDSEPVSLEMFNTWFEEQPVCWQNMVNILRHRDDPLIHSDFEKAINLYLATWNLTYARSPLMYGRITGLQSNLTNWMLSHA
jgi:hypothetical protein